ncbi:MAG: hypothetical protein H7A25_18475 [Leptospiraceae bacterium]|nr:hypothetical protein [Leptospiraceae bacterium]
MKKRTQGKKRSRKNKKRKTAKRKYKVCGLENSPCVGIALYSLDTIKVSNRDKYLIQELT